MPRRENDFYPTPESLTYALLHYLGDRLQKNHCIFEPCAGQGHISNALKGHWVGTGDIDPAMAVDIHADARHLKFDDTVDWVITNPPFNQAFAILKNFMEQPTVLRIAFLLRLSFLEPTEERGALLRAIPPTDLVVLPRTSFTADGKTDSVTCAWMIWSKLGREFTNQVITIYTKQELADIQVSNEIR